MRKLLPRMMWYLEAITFQREYVNNLFTYLGLYNPDFPSFCQTIITYKTYALHRLTALWGEDAAEFKPERWLSSEFRAKLHPYQLSFPPFSSLKKIFVGWRFSYCRYIPFHAGPRICLGMKQAFYEAKLMLTLLYQRYRLTPVPGHTVVYKKGKSVCLFLKIPYLLFQIALTMPTKFGVKMYIQHRSE